MAYTEHLWILCPNGNGKPSAIDADNNCRKDSSKPIIRICIHEDSEAEEITTGRKNFSAASFVE